MNTNTLNPIARGIGLTVALVVLVAAVSATAVQAADPPVSKKLKRQIGVMEKVIDEVLVESPNLLVFGSNVTRGVYLDEFGALFTLEAALVGEDWKSKKWGGLNQLFIKNDDGSVTIGRISDDDEDEEDERDDAKDEERRKHDEDPDQWHQDEVERHAKLYALGKEELVETLMDYGDSLTGLRDNQWLGIAAFFKGSSFFMDQKISRLVIKARMSDLREYGNERISQDAMLSRLVIEEY